MNGYDVDVDVDVDSVASSKLLHSVNEKFYGLVVKLD